MFQRTQGAKTPLMGTTGCAILISPVIQARPFPTPSSSRRFHFAGFLERSGNALTLMWQREQRPRRRRERSRSAVGKTGQTGLRQVKRHRERKKGATPGHIQSIRLHGTDGGIGRGGRSRTTGHAIVSQRLTGRHGQEMRVLLAHLTALKSTEGTQSVNLSSNIQLEALERPCVISVQSPLSGLVGNEGRR